MRRLGSRRRRRGRGKGEKPRSLVCDKGYHSDAVIEETRERGYRSYIAEPTRGRRRWRGRSPCGARYTATVGGFGESRHPVAETAPRTDGAFVRALLRDRGDAPGVVAGSGNIRKRLLIHTSAFNLSLLMRQLTGSENQRAAEPGYGGDTASLAARRGLPGRHPEHVGPLSDCVPRFSRPPVVLGRVASRRNARHCSLPETQVTPFSPQAVRLRLARRTVASAFTGSPPGCSYPLNGRSTSPAIRLANSD